jgi:hypothetical protein
MRGILAHAIIAAPQTNMRKAALDLASDPISSSTIFSQRYCSGPVCNRETNRTLL